MARIELPTQVVEDMALARGAGNTWRSIAEQYGVSLSTARRVVRRWALDGINTGKDESATGDIGKDSKQA